MITSEITVTCTTKPQMESLGSFIWPAGSQFGRIVPVSVTETKLENCCTEGTFENAVTGLALHFAQKHPGVKFKIAGWLENTESCYRETIDVEYNGTSLVTHLATEDYMFRNGKTCKDCGTSLSEVYNTEGFACPNCGSRYLPAGHEEECNAEYVFSNDACTYTIPAEEIHRT